MFKKIEVFHFVENYANPIVALQTAIESTKTNECVANSLIVVPEAFNIKTYYKASGHFDHDHDPAVASGLQGLSKDFAVTFVAGLIRKEPGGPTPPYNSAYLIDEFCSILMCRKKEPDTYGDPELRYTLCKKNCDPENPTWHSGVCLASVICVDVHDHGRPESVIAKFPESGPKIVCIPACMGTPFSCYSVASFWGKHYVILANSDRSGIGSFVSYDGGFLGEPEKGHENKVVLVKPR
jgi:predicted amidohydrolase